MKENVFKFPDGNGGWFFKCQDPSGRWGPCDEDGNPLPEQKPACAPSSTPAPLRRRGRPRKDAQADAAAGQHRPVRKAVRFEPAIELYEKLNAYMSWSLLNGDSGISRNEIVSRALEHFLDEDSGFQDYLRRNRR